MILFAVTGLSCAAAALAVARLWDLTVVVLVIVCAAQVLLLVSPPVYGRTRRPAPVQVRARGWGQLVRRAPPWLLPWRMLAGVLLTLAFLGHLDWVAVPGCRPGGSHGCLAMAEGYPRYWLSADRGVPVISKGALLADCAQWALASTALLYLAWLWLVPPARASD